MSTAIETAFTRLAGFPEAPSTHVYRWASVSSTNSPVDAVGQGEEALHVMRSWPGYAATPLRPLGRMAARLGLSAIFYKDESRRFGLSSFKPLGAAYALGREVGRALDMPSDSSFECLCDAVSARGAPFRAVCASDGNHGRAVAWAAARLGLGCMVFLHQGVSEARESAIRKEGADVRRVHGNYDDSVREAAEQARLNGWRVISDTAYGGYERVPGDVMAGYAALGTEIESQLPAGVCPTHIFVQVGVGGLAAAIIDYFSFAKLVNICVEPETAACLLQSALAGERAIVEGPLDTVMAGLACGEPSTLAWGRLARHDVHFIAIPDTAAMEAMRVLADPLWTGTAIEAGESGAAGAAGLFCGLANSQIRQKLGLASDSVVLLIGTEGATDPVAYREILSKDVTS